MLVGFFLGWYGAYIVKLIAKHNEKLKAPYVRFIGTCSVAVIGPLCIYFLRNGLGRGEDLPLHVALAFSGSIIISFILFFVAFKAR